jgi:AAA domain, putative AbiEii toxin, Type IV TA system
LLQQLDLRNFKAFERHTLYLHESAFLVGPNSAGKSTIIEALRLCAQLIQHARHFAAGGMRDYDGRRIWAYSFGLEQFEFVSENLRHEFQDELETRIELRFKDSGFLRVVWPGESGDWTETPFFYLEMANGMQLHRPTQVKPAFPELGVIPLLSPIERSEPILDTRYVRRNIDGRLSSRHFRNQLRLLDEEAKRGEPTFEEFVAFASPWVPELQLRRLSSHMGEKELELDLYYRETGIRSDREVFWAGDGVQVWLQLLLHAFRLRDASTLVLDEPDVFLHADLQRRLVRLLESLGGQTITATHSPEILAEASPESVIWVDKTRRRGVRAPKQSILWELSESLGSQFNLRLARALRSKAVLFVEGDDLKILRNIAETIGAHHVAAEVGIAVVPLYGFTNWKHLQPFAWLAKDLLEGSVSIFAILDRDYRSPESAARLVSDLGAVGVEGHVWERKELESYLLHPAAIARSSGAPRGVIEAEISDAVEGMKGAVFARRLDERQRELISAGKDRVNITEDFQREFDTAWSNATQRLALCPPKEIISWLNGKIEKLGKRSISARKLSKALRASEVPNEMVQVLLKVEDATI